MQAITTEGQAEVVAGFHRGFTLLEFAHIHVTPAFHDECDSEPAHLIIQRAYRAIRSKNGVEVWKHLRTFSLEELCEQIDQHLHEVRNPLPF